MGTRLYVGNISFNTTEGDLERHFEQAGNVVSCNMIVDKFSNQSKGFGFVEFGSEEEANKAIDMFNGKDFDGRTLTVNEARPREERGGGRGFGGGGGGGGGGGRRNRY